LSNHVLTKPELRHTKPDRADFPALPRNPITVVLDGVTGNYNHGAIFRLCDAFLCERLVICGRPVERRHRRFVQAAKGAQCWVPWGEEADAAAIVRALKATGHWIGVVELTAGSVDVTAMEPRYPAVLVLGSERAGVSPGVLACADQAVAIPMLGMANSLNVATACAIVLHEMLRRHAPKTAIASANRERTDL
jgi:tRNA (guanosine-2'-O-)-methyltransferase